MANPKFVFVNDADLIAVAQSGVAKIEGKGALGVWQVNHREIVAMAALLQTLGLSKSSHLKPTKTEAKKHTPIDGDQAI